MENNIAKQAIEVFLRLFSAKVEIEDTSSVYIYYGVCSWEDDEDTQDIKWINIYNDEALLILKKICLFVSDNNLNHNDKIVVSEEILRNKLSNHKWSDYEIDIGLEILMSFDVLMYDDGEYADCFLLHF
ncbi:MAG: hypothetical protein CVT96_09240 [Bacteroidetes bacterium HGW-Bacteroidetes-13]|nr:MAG: hypothetical protein CVT96_09240 [Bacteroidetes bacterium HGW-Bacteroidetes-13]